VRDVGIASLDALDFVPAIAFPSPEGEPEKRKGKGRRQIDAYDQQLAQRHDTSMICHHQCIICHVLCNDYCLLVDLSSLSLSSAILRVCVRERTTEREQKLSGSLSSFCKSSCLCTPGPGPGRPAAVCCQRGGMHCRDR